MKFPKGFLFTLTLCREMSLLNIFFLILTIHFYDTKAIVSGQDVPPTPCPDVFNYYEQPNGDIAGRITVPSDGSTTLSLGVNASMKGYYTDKRKVSLKIKMVTPDQDLIEKRATSVIYSVTFPFQHTIPKITSIDLNHRRYCSGPPEELVAGAPGVTSLWAGHTFYFQTENQNDKAQPVNPDEDKRPPVTPNERYPPISFPSHSSNQRFDNTVEPADPRRNQYQQCGVGKSTIPLILGGTDIADGTFPWLAAIFAFHGVAYEYKCTGNLVSEKHIITAARCLFYYKVQIVQTGDILFVLGKSNLRNWATNGAVTRGASDIRSHPDFNLDSGHADVSVVTLDRPLQFSSTISPICLWSGNNELAAIVNKKGTVAGWGADKKAPQPGQYSVLVAKSVDLPVVSQEECLNSNLTYYSLTSEATFCAGQRDGTGTCIGDVGAGFMINLQGKYYLRGLASMHLVDSKGECDPSFFMIFCDVAKFTDWIKIIIR